MLTESNLKEFQELTDEGLVSSARERFTTGNILGSQAGRRRSSVETNYIDKNHIDSLTSKFEESASGRLVWWCWFIMIIDVPQHNIIAGKATKAEVISASCVPRKLKNLDDIFHHNKDDYTDCAKRILKWFPKVCFCSD